MSHAKMRALLSDCGPRIQSWRLGRGAPDGEFHHAYRKDVCLGFEALHLTPDQTHALAAHKDTMDAYA
jgi:hypothetical protein